MADDHSPYILSTRWAQQARFADMHDFARAARSLGYDAIEVSHATDQERLERLMDGPTARLTSIHAPAPKTTVKGKPNSDLNLASLDKEHRRIAIHHTNRSINYAARAAA